MPLSPGLQVLCCTTKEQHTESHCSFAKIEKFLSWSSKTFKKVEFVIVPAPLYAPTINI